MNKDTDWFGKTVAVLTIIIGVIAIIVPVYVSYDLQARQEAQKPNRSLTLDRSFVNDLTRAFSESAIEINYDISVQGQQVRTLLALNESLVNTGTDPLVPNDFITPLTIRVEAPWRILTVANQTVSFKQTLTPKWKRKSATEFEAEPFLFNPDDELRVVIYITTDHTDYRSLFGANVYTPKITQWNARIPHVERIVEKEIKRNPDFMKGVDDFVDAWPGVYVILYGKGLLLFLALTSVLGFVLLYLAHRSFAWKDLPRWKLAVMILAIFNIAMSTGEVLSYYMVSNAFLETITGTRGWGVQLPNLIVILIFLLASFYLIRKSKLLNPGKQTVRTEGTTPDSRR